jgi:hypothetical protein
MRAFLEMMTGSKATGWTMSGSLNVEESKTSQAYLEVRSRWQCVGLTERRMTLLQVALRHANAHVRRIDIEAWLNQLNTGF